MKAKIDEVGCQNRPKNDKKSTQNKNRSKIDLGGSWGGLGTLLTPRWPQDRKSHQKGHKSITHMVPSWEPKSIQNRSGGLPKSITFFDGFWDQVLVAFGPNMAPTWPPKPSQNGAKMAQKSIKKLIKILMQILINFGADLGRFWDGFGGQVAAKFGPNATNTRPHYFLEGLRIDFGWILAPKLAPNKGKNYFNFRVFLALGPILAPRRPQDAPRSPKRRPRQPPRPILEPFWWIFG